MSKEVCYNVIKLYYDEDRIVPSTSFFNPGLTHRIKVDISKESLNESSNVNLELVQTQDV